MKLDEVIKTLRSLYIKYNEENIGQSPALLTEHLAKVVGYANILYSHYAEILERYRIQEATIMAEENDSRNEWNDSVEKREDKRTVDEKNDRITVRLNPLKGQREKIEAEVKSATLHINTIQSLLKQYSDQAKGLS